jgi:hypothetical protein
MAGRYNLMKCYISGIRFYKNDKLVLEEKNSYHLLDMANEASMKCGSEYAGRFLL